MFLVNHEQFCGILKVVSQPKDHSSFYHFLVVQYSDNYLSHFCDNPSEFWTEDGLFLTHGYQVIIRDLLLGFLAMEHHKIGHDHVQPDPENIVLIENRPKYLLFSGGRPRKDAWEKGQVAREKKLYHLVSSILWREK